MLRAPISEYITTLIHAERGPFKLSQDRARWPVATSISGALRAVLVGGHSDGRSRCHVVAMA